MPMSPGSAFLRFWWTDRTRDTFLTCMSKEDLASLRLACHDFSIRAAPLLFEEITITFRPSIFTKPARMAALDRLGHHIRTLTFSMAHGPETFLPPLLDPETGIEETIIYEPYVQSNRDGASRISAPTYGSWEMTDLLVKQYPPLFHAAANVPSFMRAFSAIPNMKHLKISCPGQEPTHRYRRSTVDYALISLRIAIERTNLKALDTLSLASVHPGAVLYLNPSMGFATLPSSAKRWRQIRKLAIHMDSIPLSTQLPADHLKLLHSYLQQFSTSVRQFKFRWHGTKGPCPLSLGKESCLQEDSPKLACPKRCHLAVRPLRFTRLRDLEVENIVTDAPQISSFIYVHRRTLREFNFEDTHLRNGTWDEALSPLTRISGSDNWKEKSVEVMDVPLMLSPVGLPEQQLQKVICDYARTRSIRPPYARWQRAGAKSRELFWGTPEHMKKFLRSSVFSWI